MIFKTHLECEGETDEIAINSYCNNRVSLASGLDLVFVPETPKEQCDRVSLVLQRNKSGNDSKGFDNEISAMNDKTLEN